MHDHHTDKLTIDLEQPEKLAPLFVFPFVQASINDGKEVADGFDLQIWDAHVMDVVNDKFKVQIVGSKRNQLLIEMPKVKHPYHHHFNAYYAKLRPTDMFYEDVFKQHILARNELLEDESRFQKHVLLSIPEAGGTLSCEYFPLDRSTTGDEVDYDVVPYLTDDRNGQKVYRCTNVVLSWKVIFEDTIRAAKRPKAKGKLGKSKLDGIDEGMDNLNVNDEF